MSVMCHLLPNWYGMVHTCELGERDLSRFGEHCRAAAGGSGTH